MLGAVNTNENELVLKRERWDVAAIDADGGASLQELLDFERLGMISKGSLGVKL